MCSRNFFPFSIGGQFILIFFTRDVWERDQHFPPCMYDPLIRFIANQLKSLSKMQSCIFFTHLFFKGACHAFFLDVVSSWEWMFFIAKAPLMATSLQWPFILSWQIVHTFTLMLTSQQQWQSRKCIPTRLLARQVYEHPVESHVLTKIVHSRRPYNTFWMPTFQILA